MDRAILRREHPLGTVSYFLFAFQEDPLGEEQQDPDDDAAAASSRTADHDDTLVRKYDYLLNMQLIKLSEEEVAKLLRERDLKEKELSILRAKTPKDMWLEDLDAFLIALDKQEAKEKEEEAADLVHGLKMGAGAKKEAAVAKSGGEKVRKAAVVARATETMPSAKGRRVEPVVDSATKEKFEKADKAKEYRSLGIKKPTKMEKEDSLENTPLMERVKKRLLNDSGSSTALGLGDAKRQLSTSAVPSPAPSSSSAPRVKSETDPWASDADEQNGATRREFSDSDSDYDDSNSAKAKKRKRPVSKSAATKKPKVQPGTAADGDGLMLAQSALETPKKKRSKPAQPKTPKKKKPADSDSDSASYAGSDGDVGSATVQYRSDRPGRARKQINYRFDESGEENEEDL